MEKIKHLKIETTTYIFFKFMRMHWIVFDSCMHSFFALTDVGAGGASDRLIGRAGLNQFIEVVGQDLL
jgi:hypothetical protein